MKNTLFFPIWTVPPHFETDLELILQEIDNGNNVYVLFCNHDLNICDNLLLCKNCNTCVNITRNGLKKIVSSKRKINIIPLKKYIKKNSFIKENMEFTSKIDSIDDLKKMIYKTFNIGYGIMSSLAIELDSSSFNDCKSKIQTYYFEAILFYECITSIITDYSISLGYVFNGRFCFSRIFAQAFFDQRTTFFTHDRGSNYNQYRLSKNTLPHNIKSYTESVNNYWDQENDIFLKKNIADIFFKKRAIGLETSYISFTANQNLSKLPMEIYNYKKKIVIFNSSNFEYDYISEEYSYKFYHSQNDGISQIVNSLKDNSDFGIFLREHPNQKNRINIQRKQLREIIADNFYLISAESDISSYKLLLNADIVITFNSTMGVEATYWGIPSILCSNAIYENFSIAYMPSSHEEVIDLIKSDLHPISNDDVYKYGYYEASFGIPFRHYKPSSLSNGLFMGIDFHATKDSFLDKTKKLLKRFKKHISLKIKHHLLGVK